MRKTKIFALLISSTILLGAIGGVFAYQEYIYRWINNGAGGTHGACHGSANTKASVTGTLVLTVNETGSLLKGQAFELSVAVLNFTEANLPVYDGRITVGVPGYRGDNGLFTSGLSHQTLNRRESVDSYGSYNHSGSNNEFVLHAPMAIGTYDLFALAICAVNQSDASAYNITYVEDSIQITVIEIIDTTHPVITVSPSIKTVAHGYTGESFSWTATDLNPDTYMIRLDGTINETATAWTSGGAVSYSIPDELTAGPHVIKIIFSDVLGNTESHTAVLIVSPEATSAAPATISGGIFGITLGVVIGITTIAMFKMKKRMRKKKI